MQSSNQWISQPIFDEMVRLRRDLHQHPELSGHESRTAQAIAAIVRGAGLEVHENIGGHGLWTDLPGEHEGPRVALRADMDALPIVEETDLPFASRRDGVMHACGHDAHSSMLIGALRALVARPAPLPVRLIWQPAEETARGALAMIEDHVLEGVGMIFGGHVDRHYPPGVIAVSEGAVNASTDTFEIQITGKGGHGARPHETLDAVVAGSLLVTSLQTIVSREVDPAHPSVLTVGSFHAGTAPNVIAGSAILRGTIRAQDRSVQEHLHTALTRIASSIGQLHGANVQITIQRCTPPLFNLGLGVLLARDAARQVLGDGGLTELRTANMGGEDFAHFLQHVPGCYVRFGSQCPGLEDQPAHSSRFDVDERVMAAGAAWFECVARLAGQALRAGRHD